MICIPRLCRLEKEILGPGGRIFCPPAWAAGAFFFFLLMPFKETFVLLPHADPSPLHIPFHLLPVIELMPY